MKSSIAWIDTRIECNPTKSQTLDSTIPRYLHQYQPNGSLLKLKIYRQAECRLCAKQQSKILVIIIGSKGAADRASQRNLTEHFIICFRRTFEDNTPIRLDHVNGSCCKV